MKTKTLVTALDVKMDGDIVRLEGVDNKWLLLTYRQNELLIQEQFPYINEENPQQWGVTITKKKLKDHLVSLNETDIKISPNSNGGIYIQGKKGGFSVPAGDIEALVFDPAQAFATVSVEFKKNEFQHLVKAAEIAKSNGDDAPAVLKKCIEVNLFADSIKIIGRTLSFVYCPYFNKKIDGMTDKLFFKALLLPVEVVDAIALVNPTKVTLSIGVETAVIQAEGKRRKAVIFDIPTGDYIPVEQPQDWYNPIEVDRKELENALHDIGEGSEVTLTIEGEELVVENETERKNIPIKFEQEKFKGTVKVIVSALMDILKAISASKLHLLLFPGGTSLAIEAANGGFFLLFGLIKTAIETSDALNTNPAPEKVVIDQKLERVEVSPLAPTTPPKDSKEEVDRLLTEGEKTKESLDKLLLEKQVEALEAQKAETEELRKEIQRLEKAKEELDKVLADSQAKLYESELNEEELQEIALTLIWVGGRIVQFVFIKEKTWQFRIRVRDPKPVAA